jgi:hypothetical protein
VTTIWTTEITRIEHKMDLEARVLNSGRATQGVRVINLENGDKICSVAKASES